MGQSILIQKYKTRNTLEVGNTVILEVEWTAEITKDVPFGEITLFEGKRNIHRVCVCIF